MSSSFVLHRNVYLGRRRSGNGLDHSFFSETLMLNRDRSSASLPLEKRPGTLGNLLRCMSAGGLPMLQKAIEEMLWQLSGRNGES